MLKSYRRNSHAKKYRFKEENSRFMLLSVSPD